ncbi:Transporter [Candidatus Burkholderia humilis]|nr:Transporter [Candidatus Burkholderia humilis]
MGVAFDGQRRGRLVGVSSTGGIAGALLLVFTPASFFQRLVPWLVLFATLVFAFGRHLRRRAASRGNGHVYGGYFGGGIGFLMLTALTIPGQGAREAGATKNLLAMVMNASAVVIFAASGKVGWTMAGAVCVGSIAGGFAGTWLLRRLPEDVLRGFVVVVGIVLTVWLFLRA